MSASNDEIQKLANEALQAALHEADAGRPAQAGELFRAVLQLQPERAEAHVGLGLLERQAGNAAAAIPHFASALQAAPEEAFYWLVYLEVLMDARQFATARELIALGRSQGLQGQELDALERRLIEEGEPAKQEIDAAASLYAKGDEEAAEKLAHGLIERFPQHPFGWKLLGGILYGKRAYPEALEAMHKAASHGPDDVETLCNLGVMLKRAGLLEGARGVLERAIELAPDSARAYSSLAATLFEMGCLTEAYEHASHALTLQPDLVEAMNSIAVVLDNLGRSEEAILAYQRVLALNPDQYDVHGNMLFCMSHTERFTAAELFEEHLRFGRRLEAGVEARHAWELTRDPERSLRIGFLSGDLRTHAMATFVEPVFRALSDRPGLELHAYYNYPLHDETTANLRPHFAQWRDVSGLDDAGLDALIRADRIDILFDLSGHTGHNRLPVFARKPAPIQVSWLGYPGTTGLTTMDYYLCDTYMMPAGKFDHLFTEALVQLPGVAFQPAIKAPDVTPLPALENGHLTFGSFNRINKISRGVIAAWGGLLRALPDARLVLAGLPAGGAGRENLQAWLREEGIDPARTSFHERVGAWDYMSLHGGIDICLDSFPYTGGTTTLYALYMGVPTLTMASDSIVGRQSACLLMHHGLERFIAHDPEDFVSKGLAASKDLAALAQLRSTLRGSSPLWTPEGIPRIADSIEHALRTMWRRWCAGQPPVSFSAPLGPARDGGPV